MPAKTTAMSASSDFILTRFVTTLSRLLAISALRCDVRGAVFVGKRKLGAHQNCVERPATANEQIDYCKRLTNMTAKFATTIATIGMLNSIESTPSDQSAAENCKTDQIAATVQQASRPHRFAVAESRSAALQFDCGNFSAAANRLTGLKMKKIIRTGQFESETSEAAAALTERCDGNDAEHPQFDVLPPVQLPHLAERLNLLTIQFATKSRFVCVRTRIIR